MRSSSTDRARPARVSGAILTWLAVASLLVTAGAGAIVAVPCAHHGHAGHSVPAPIEGQTYAGTVGQAGHDALHHQTHASDHASHGPDRPDEDGGCDCAGSCTISSSAPQDSHAGIVTPLFGYDAIDLLPAVREPHAHFRPWLFPLPNAPPRT
jgi:hypothetical protein